MRKYAYIICLNDAWYEVRCVENGQVYYINASSKAEAQARRAQWLRGEHAA